MTDSLFGTCQIELGPYVCERKRVWHSAFYKVGKMTNWLLKTLLFASFFLIWLLASTNISYAVPVFKEDVNSDDLPSIFSGSNDVEPVGEFQSFVQVEMASLPISPPFPNKQARVALVLNGASYVDIEGVEKYFEDGAKVTVECWVRAVFPGDTTACTLFSVMSTSNNNTNTLVKIAVRKDFASAPSKGIYVSGTIMGRTDSMYANLNGWTHVAWVYDGRSDAIYINGKKWFNQPRLPSRVQSLTSGKLRLGSKELTNRGQYESDATSRLEVTDFRISTGTRYRAETSPPSVEPLSVDAATVCLLDFSKPNNVIADKSGNQFVGRVRGGHWHMVDATRSGRIRSDSTPVTIRNVRVETPYIETQPLIDQNTGLLVYRKYVAVEDTAALIQADRRFTAEMWFSVSRSETWKILSAVSPTSSNFAGVARDSWSIAYSWNPRLSDKHIITWTSRHGSISWTTKKPPQRWRHVAICYDGASLSVFLDGTFIGRADSPTHLELIKNGWPLKLGDLLIGDKNNSSQDAPLVAHSFRLSTKVRYFQSFDPPNEFTSDAETASILRFDRGVGNLKDLSNNGRNGKLSDDTVAWVEYASPVGVHYVEPVRALEIGTGIQPPASIKSPAIAKRPSQGARPMPPAGDLNKARDEFQAVFKSDIEKATTQANKRNLGRRLSGIAEATQDYDAVRYILYMESAKMAIKAEDRQTALQSLAACGRYFDADMSRQVIAVYQELVKKVSRPDAVGFTADVIREMEVALRDENTSKATALTEIANTAAARSRDTDTRKLATAASDKCREAVAVIVSYRRGLEALKTDSADQNAIEDVADYHYNHRRDWKAAAAVLAGHPSTSIQDALKAEADLSLENTPSVRGDHWGDSISTVNKQLDKLCASRAIYWYQRSLSQLQGIEKMQAEKKIKDLKETHRLD
jgi:hypothetical protein